MFHLFGQLILKYSDAFNCFRKTWQIDQSVVSPNLYNGTTFVIIIFFFAGFHYRSND